MHSYLAIVWQYEGFRASQIHAYTDDGVRHRLLWVGRLLQPEIRRLSVNGLFGRQSVTESHVRWFLQILDLYKSAC